MLRYTFPTKIMLVALALNWVVQNFETNFTAKTIHEEGTEIFVVPSHGGIAKDVGSVFKYLI